MELTEIAKQTDTEPEVLSKVISSDEAPHIDTLNIIANALGCRLSIEPIAAAIAQAGGYAREFFS